MTQTLDQSRRRFLHTGLVALAGIAAAHPALASLPRFTGTRALSFHNLHTDEKLHVAYWKDGKYDHAAWNRINYFLRDFRSGDVYPMNIRLMDLLFDLQGKLRNDNAIEVISGYRSPKTNMMLVNLTDGVARNSYHTHGMAIDIRLPGTSLPHLHNVALAMRRGGVGYYPDSEFVHVDVGPVRTW